MDEHRRLGRTIGFARVVLLLHLTLIVAVDGRSLTGNLEGKDGKLTVADNGRLSGYHSTVNRKAQGSDGAGGGARMGGAPGDLHLLGLPVGQGDGTLIVCPEYDGNVIVYDMGSTTSAWTASDVRNFMLDSTLNGERSLLDRVSTVIISHAHTDHYNYVPDVFPNVGLKTDHNKNNRSSAGPSANLEVFVSATISDYIYFGMGEWLEAAGAMTFNNGKQCFTEECSIGNTWTGELCGASSPARFRVVAANMGSGSDRNEQSVVLRVENTGQSALLVGDFEGPVQNELIQAVAPDLLLSDVYKVSHHGASFKSNYPEFLEAVGARLAFISSQYAAVSQYGHPKCETLDRLQATGTLMEASAHRLDCTDAERNVVETVLDRSIYSTMPTPGTICVVNVTMTDLLPEPFLDVDCN